MIRITWHLSAAVTAAGLAVAAPALAQDAAEAEHPRHHGRRHRLLEHLRLQPRPDGLSHPEHRPAGRGGRALHRLLRPAVLHRRPRRLHHRPEPDAHRAPEGRAARRARGPAGRGPDDRRPPEAARLHDRPVRQEPPRRPQRVPADGARLRRVLRQPLPPQRRGRAGASGLSEGHRVPRDLRAARGDALPGHQRGDARRRPALRGLGQADLRGHRPARHQAHGDGGRGVPRRHPRLHRPGARGEEAVLRLVQPQPHAHLDPAEAGVAGRDRPRPLSRRHGRA